MRSRSTGGEIPGDCLARINRALDHVRSHLGEPLPLADVARVACFSPCHFHRVFKAVVGETLLELVHRLRLEKAIAMMSRHDAPSLTQIAIACGFASSSDFSRAFKQHYGVPPSRFDTAALRERRRGELVEMVAGAKGTPRLERPANGTNPDRFEPTIRRLPARTLAYLRVHDPYRTGGVVPACERLVRWATTNGCADNRWYGYQWEDPEVTPLELCRYDVAVEVDDVQPQGEIGRVRFDAMEVAVIEVVGDIALEMRALDWLMGTWLPLSGRTPADLPCFEAWRGRPYAHGMSHFELEIHLPLE